MITSSPQPTAFPFLQGGETGNLIREYNWSQTSLGTPDTWPQSLRTTVSNLLRSRFPMFLWWGPDLIQFYNDAYRPSLGNEGKHPTALGQKGEDCWPEIWPVIHPMIQLVKEAGEPTWMENQLIPIYRNGKLEDVYWTFSYSLVLNDDDAPGGVLVTCMETTGSVMDRKRVEESEAKLRAILNSAPTAIGVFVGPDLMVENANQLLIDLMAAGPDIEGQSFRQLLAGLVDEDHKFIQIIDGVRTTGKPFEAQEVGVYFKAEKRTRYFNISFLPLRDETGTVYAVLDVSADVTEQVAARKKIEDSETFNRTVLENSPDCVKIIDAEGRLQFMNTNGLCTMEIDDFSQFKNSVWRDLWGSENRQLVNESITAALSGKTVQFQAFCPTAKGTPKWWDVMVSPVQLPGSDKITSLISVSRDITKQIVAQKEIEESEARFRSLIEEAPIPTALFVGREMMIKVANEPMLGVWGKGDGVFGKPLAEALPELEGQPFLKILDEVFTKGETLETKGAPANLIVDGVMSTYYFDYTFKPLRNAAGVVYGIMDMAVDVTEQVTARKKIEESEAKLKSLIAAAPIGIGLFIGRDLVIENPNQEFIDIVGKGPDIAGKPLTDVMPELAEYGQPYLKILDDVFTTGVMYQSLGDPVKIVRRGVMHNGFYNIYYVPLFDAEGKVYGIMDIATDVTEQVASRKKLEESEQRFLKLADESPIFIFIIDDGPTAPVSYWNTTWLRYTGQTWEAAAGRAWDGIIHPDDVPIVMAHYTPAFQAKEEYFIPAVRVKRHDGVYRWHSFKGNPRYLPGGEFGGYIGVGFDIHEQKETAEELENIVSKRTEELWQINKELQRSNAHLEEFAHAASHDLKEPIRKITFFTHQLRDQLSSQLQEAELRSFNRIENATERMGALIDDLLLYSHVSQRPHEKESIDLTLKLKRVLEDLELDIQEREAIIHAAALPVVKGYRRQLQQLLQNLISNALKYSKAGVPPQITITASLENENGHPYHVIAVADNGIGFDQQYSEKIFQMFSRLHGKQEYSGTGVGLSIVKKVVENHNGFIRVKSSPGNGSTFEVFLPME